MSTKSFILVIFLMSIVLFFSACSPPLEQLKKIEGFGLEDKIEAYEVIRIKYRTRKYDGILNELREERYALILKKNKIKEADALYSKIINIPHNNFKDKYQGYEKLHYLDPENSGYILAKNKYKNLYKNKILDNIDLIHDDNYEEKLKQYEVLINLYPDNEKYIKKVYYYRIALKNKNEVEGTIRAVLASKLEINLLKRGINIDISTGPPYSTIMHCRYIFINRAFIYQLMDKETTASLRNAGFKKLTFDDTTGKVWTVPLN